MLVTFDVFQLDNGLKVVIPVQPLNISPITVTFDTFQLDSGVNDVIPVQPLNIMDISVRTQILEAPDVVATDDGKTFEYFTQVENDKPVAYAIKSTSIGFGGPLTLLVGISADRKLVLNTSVLAHSETPGLGAKCTSDEKFMSQWKGLQLESTKLEVQKPVKDGIDAITASTITSKAYTTAVANALAAFDKIVAGQVINNVEQEVEND